MVSVYLRLSAHVDQVTLISGTLLLFMINGLVLWWTSSINWQPLSIVYYLWANTSGIILTAQVWTLANHVVTTREAKRLFGLIGGGAISGWIVGGLVTRAAAMRLGTENLLLLTAVVLAICPFLVAAIWRLWVTMTRVLPA